MVTVLGGLLGLAVVGWTLEARRRVEERQDDAGREETIRALSAQLKAAGPHLRRLAALEAMVGMMQAPQTMIERVVERLLR